MRLVASVLVVSLATLLAIAGGVLVALELQRAPDWLAAGADAGVPLVVVLPVLRGAWVASWDPRASPDVARSFRRGMVVAAALDLVAVALVATATVVAQGPVWLPVVVAVVAAVLLGLSRPLGDRLRRAERPVHPGQHWQPVDPAAVRRTIAVATWTFVGSALVGAVGVAVLAVAVHWPAHRLLPLGLSVAQLVCLASAIVMALRVRPLQRGLRDLAGRDVGRLRRVAQVVVRGRDLPLDEDDALLAARYAAALPVLLGLQSGFAGLLWAGIVCNLVGDVLEGFSPGAVVLGVVVVLVAVAVPTSVRRVRRARAYAAAHADLLDGEATRRSAGGVDGAGSAVGTT